MKYAEFIYVQVQVKLPQSFWARLIDKWKRLATVFRHSNATSYDK